MKKPKKNSLIHTKPPRRELWETAVTDEDVRKMINDEAKLPELSPQAVHDLAARINEWARWWRHYSNHPEAKTPIMLEREERNRRIAEALETLQADLPAFQADTAPGRLIMFGPGIIEPLAYQVDRVAPSFAKCLHHAGTERWHVIADDLERALRANYQKEKLLDKNVLLFLEHAMAGLQVNVGSDAIRKRKQT